MRDGQPRAIAHLDCLTGQRKRARDHGLRGDDGRAGREHDQRQERPAGREQVERILDRGRVVDDQCALAEIVEHERGQHEEEPRAPNRGRAEMAHVGIERLGARDRQHDCTKREECGKRIAGQKSERVGRIEGRQDRRVACNLHRSEQRQHREPQANHRTEQNADAGGPVPLDREQPDEDCERERNHERLERGRHHFEPLDCGEHRNRRRDHAVAVEHRRAEYSENDEPPASASIGEPARDERGERHDAAFAIVVGAHDQRDVLERDDDRDRPEHDRENAVDVLFGQREAVRPGEALAQRIQRTRADVAENDADGADDKWRERLAIRRGSDFLAGRRRQHAPSSERREKRILSCFNLR